MKLLKVKRVFILFLILIIILPLAFLYFSVSGFSLHLKSVEHYSNKYGVDKSLVLAVIKTESGFDPKAISNKGAVGIMQIMPSTAVFIAEKLGLSNYDLTDSDISINFGTFYLSYLLKKYSEEFLAICAYNAGEGTVNKWLKQGKLSKNNIPYKETKNYIKKVNFRKKLYEIVVK